MSKATATTTATVSRETLENVIDAIKAIDEQLNSSRASLAQMKKEAAEKISNEVIPVEDYHLPADKKSMTIAEMRTWVETVTQWFETAEDDLIESWIMNNKHVPKAKLSSLREERSSLVDQAKGLMSILPALGIDCEGIEIPKRAGRGSVISTPVEGEQYYVEYDGKPRKYLAPSQNNISSIAFFHGKGLLDIPREKNEKNSVTTEELKTAINKNANTPDPWKLKTDWAVELPGGVIGVEYREAE